VSSQVFSQFLKGSRGPICFNPLLTSEGFPKQENSDIAQLPFSGLSVFTYCAGQKVAKTE